MQNTEEITAIVQTEKWQLPFDDLLDEIYYEGYAEQLSKNYPDAYAREYFYFLALYD